LSGRIIGNNSRQRQPRSNESHLKSRPPHVVASFGLGPRRGRNAFNFDQPRRGARSLDRPLKLRRKIFASGKHGRGGELRALKWQRLNGRAHPDGQRDLPIRPKEC